MADLHGLEARLLRSVGATHVADSDRWRWPEEQTEFGTGSAVERVLAELRQRVRKLPTFNDIEDQAHAARQPLAPMVEPMDADELSEAASEARGLVNRPRPITTSSDTIGRHTLRLIATVDDRDERLGQRTTQRDALRERLGHMHGTVATTSRNFGGVLARAEKAEALLARMTSLWARVNDEKALSLIAPSAVADYLGATATWKKLPSIKSFRMWQHAGTGECCAIPQGQTFADYGRRMLECLGTIAQAEERSQLGVLVDLWGHESKQTESATAPNSNEGGA